VGRHDHRRRDTGRKHAAPNGGGGDGRDGRCCGADPTDLERFVSFSLSPQEQKLIVVRAEFDNCVGWAAGTVQSFSVPTIRFRVLGVTRRVQLSASWTIQVRSPPDADCPGRSG